MADGGMKIQPSDYPAAKLAEDGRPWNEVRPEFVALMEKTFGPSG